MSANIPGDKAAKPSAPRDNRKHDARKLKAAPVPVLPVPPSAGARPLSARQRGHLSEQKAHLAHLHAAHAHRPEAILRREVLSVHRPDVRGNVTAGKLRPGAATAARQRAKQRANRPNHRKVDWARVLLRVATAGLCVEIVAALLFSPRLWVRSVSFAGNATVPTERLAARLAVPANANLLTFLTRSRKLLAVLRAEPGVARVLIRPTLAPGLAITVRERTPFAAVKFDSDPGRWYTLDARRVPFRVFDALPEAGLPLVSVATRGAVSATSAAKPMLGRVCDAPGLADVGTCLAWATAQGANFPVEKVSIDNAGKLCLNRAGGMKVLLGPGLELSDKLNTLSLLLNKRMDLRGSAPTTIAAVNLYAYDAPALVPRPAVAPGKAGEQTGETAAP